MKWSGSSFGHDPATPRFRRSERPEGLEGHTTPAHGCRSPSEHLARLAPSWGSVYPAREEVTLSYRRGIGDGASPYELARASLLGQGSLQEKLHVVVQGDPLDLYERAAAAIRNRCIWLSPLRACDESVFTAIAMAPTYSKGVDFEAWLEERIQDAIENLLRRDREALRDEAITKEMVSESSLYLAEHLSFEPGAALRASIRFNSLPPLVRRAHFAVFVEGKSVAECLEAGLGPAEALANNLHRSSRVILDEVATFRVREGYTDSEEEST